MTKLAGQIIAAGLLAWQGILISLPFLDGVAAVSPFMSLTLTVFIVVLVMNAINFIDGLDGLVAGVAIIANSVFFVYTLPAATADRQTDYFNLSAHLGRLIGACVGFLPLNWHPAKLFMGDAGALLVGLLMAASTIAVTGQIDADRVRPPDRSPSCSPPSSRSCCRSPSCSCRCSTSASPSSAGCGQASRRSPPTASTCITGCSTWATATCTRC